jgi:hypothetical protein
MSVKTKTQITVNHSLNLILSMVKKTYPLFDTNQAVEFLLAKGSGAYLSELELSMQDLEDIQKSRDEIKNGKSTKANSIDDLLQKLKS